MSERREDLPWHVRAGQHVYVYAGGDTVRRMHHSFYVLMVHGMPVEAETLTADPWRNIGAFEAACAEHERRQAPKLILPPKPLLITR